MTSDPYAHGGGHGAGDLGWTVAGLITVLTLSSAAAGYLWLVWSTRHRSPWPRHRVLLWLAGVGCLAVALTGPVAAESHASFTGHMLSHLLLGMLAPLLLVRAAPVTLLLRALPVGPARRLTRLLAHPVLGILTHPATAAVLNLGGLWLLYSTDLYRLMHVSAPVHAVVHMHLFLAGYLFTDAVVGIDPRRHRAGFATRAAVLVVFVALHSVLAKWLYAHPPAGVGTADARSGAQLMYYAGDAVDVTLIVLLFWGAYRSTGIRTPSTRAPWPASKNRASSSSRESPLPVQNQSAAVQRAESA